MGETSVIKAEGITRVFPVPGGEFTALNGINAEIPKGKFAILKGRSGSGKTTLMNILGTLDEPTAGNVYINGNLVKGLSERDKENLRRKEMGFVFQSVSLIPSLNAFQNVEFSMRMAGIKPSKETDKRVEECLRLVGLANRANHMPAEMSGGEQQRIAVARAFAHHPKIIFADEPTGALDTASGLAVIGLFKELIEKEGITIIMTTHDPNLMSFGDAVYEMEDGELRYVSNEQ